MFGAQTSFAKEGTLAWQAHWNIAIFKLSRHHDY